MSTSSPSAEFDVFADNYDAALHRGLALVGENKEYFSRGRLHWLARRLAQLDESPSLLLDFGCGIGDSTPHFFDILGVKQLVGVDISADSIQRAREHHGSCRAEFITPNDFVADESFDLAFTNGTFHHIPPSQRADSLSFIYSAVRPGGWFAFWENNPWNPGTRWVMSKVPFDRDAQLLWPRQARRLIQQAGFDPILTDFAFVFPHCLRYFRRWEHHLCKLPLGGQYMILARKPTVLRRPWSIH
jgi:SAM-dependent methyltransferase